MHSSKLLAIMALFVAAMGMPTLLSANVSTTGLDAVNAYRAGHNLPALVQLDVLCAIADLRLQAIHTNFSHAGFFLWAPILDKYGYWFENLAKGYGTPTDAVLAWENSADHEANLTAGASYGCVVEDNGYWVFMSYRSL